MKQPTHCWCNICGLPMTTMKYIPGANYCCRTCRDMAHKPRNMDAYQHGENYCRKARMPVALRMSMKM